MKKYCDFCLNATIDSDLTPDNDLSYIGVGKMSKGYSMHIRSGDDRPTALVISKYEKDSDQNITIGVYNMKYCPECGRQLIENYSKDERK